jgi:myosin heavy subunit
VLALPQAYTAEGVAVPATTFKDNRPTLSLLEDKAQGVFAMIDEEMSVPKGSDETYLNKVKNRHGKHESFGESRVDTPPPLCARPTSVRDHASVPVYRQRVC